MEMSSRVNGQIPVLLLQKTQVTKKLRSSLVVLKAFNLKHHRTLKLISNNIQNHEIIKYSLAVWFYIFYNETNIRIRCVKAPY